MTFEDDKQVTLSREDKSLKGSIDKYVAELCNAINTRPDYYTTSSCVGCINLTKVPKSGKKKDHEWLFTSHDTMTETTLKDSLKELPDDEVGFRMDPFIVHVVARTLEHAASLLTLLTSLCIKRAGINSMKERIVLEIIGTEHIETLISKDGQLLVDEKYISTLTNTANRKLKKNHEKIVRITETIKEL